MRGFHLLQPRQYPFKDQRVLPNIAKRKKIERKKIANLELSDLLLQLSDALVLFIILVHQVFHKRLGDTAVRACFSGALQSQEEGLRSCCDRQDFRVLDGRDVTRDDLLLSVRRLLFRGLDDI